MFSEKVEWGHCFEKVFACDGEVSGDGIFLVKPGGVKGGDKEDDRRTKFESVFVSGSFEVGEILEFELVLKALSDLDKPNAMALFDELGAFVGDGCEFLGKKLRGGISGFESRGPGF